MVSDKKSRELSGILLSVVLVTLRDILLAIIGCDSACFSPAFIFARWTRGPPKPACRQPCIEDLCAQALYVQRDE